MDQQYIDIIVTVIVALLSSTGLWHVFENKRNKLIKAVQNEEKADCNMKELLVALAKAQICHMATIYIERGWITNNEADILEQTFKPYHELGGNGAGEVLYRQAISLPRKGTYAKKGD